MQEFPFHRFIDLVAFDQQLIIKEREVLQLEKEIDSFEQQKLDQLKKLTAIYDHWKLKKKNVDEKELEMKTLDDAEKAVQRKLDTLQNSKEYTPLKKELEQLKAKQHTFEQTLLTAWNEVEAAQREYDAAKIVCDQKTAELQVQIAERSTKAQEISLITEELEKQRLEKTKEIPQEWLEKYNIMKSRVSNPVVPVIEGVCSGCYYQIISQDMAALRKRALVQCKNCFRFLYLESAYSEV